MNPQYVVNKKVTVLGGARSGVAVAQLLATTGAMVFLSEKRLVVLGLDEKLGAVKIPHEVGGHSERVLDADFIVVSPGVPSSLEILQQAKRKGLAIYSELEVASWFCKAPIIAVTGTNGKTTTTSLIGHIFRSAGHTTIVAGNIGDPFSNHVLESRPEDMIVLEVSSFQLDHIAFFKPRVGVLLNITPDHLDRYNNSFADYMHSKFRLIENQQRGDVLVYNHDDIVVRDFVNRISGKSDVETLGVSQHYEIEAGAFLRDSERQNTIPEIIIRINQQEEILMQADKLSLTGRHNLYNSLAAAVAARVMEIRNDVVRESLMTFEGVPHRLEFVRELDGVRYVNDSKATNVNAVWYALESFDKPVILIAGGREKANDYHELKPLIRRKVKAVIAIGESADRVIGELGSEIRDSIKVTSMEEAVRFARLLADAGDVVLLSPACASFDMYQNYEERGDSFKRIVHQL